MAHHKPVLDLSLPFLIVEPGSLREPEPPQHPAEQHPHLHQRQVLPGTDRRTVRKRNESSRVVFSRGRALAEPSLWQERVRVVEVTRIAMDAVCVKEELRLLRDHPTHGPSGSVRTYCW